MSDTQPRRERPELREKIRRLEDAYTAYQAALASVLDEGDASIQPLINALNHKHAKPIAQALGRLMHRAAAEAAIPPLLDWLPVQSPMYPEVLQALVCAGDKVLPFLFQWLDVSVSRGDDEAVRNLLDLGARFKGNQLTQVVACMIRLLGDKNADIRDAAADMLGRIGLPSGRPAVDHLLTLAKTDPNPDVRNTCEEALVRLGVTRADG